MNARKATKAMKAINAVKASLGAVILMAILAVLRPAVSAAELDDNVYNYLQMMRSDFNSAKVELVNRIMRLSAEDAQKFWPLYREYESELSKLAVNRAEFIMEFIQAHRNGTFDNGSVASGRG
jgi:hypothetical protein